MPRAMAPMVRPSTTTLALPTRCRSPIIASAVPNDGPAIVAARQSWENAPMEKIVPPEYVEAVQQLFDEAIEAVGLAKQCKEVDDLWATLAVALLKLDLASNFIEQHQP